MPACIFVCDQPEGIDPSALHATILEVEDRIMRLAPTTWLVYTGKSLSDLTARLKSAMPAGGRVLAIGISRPWSEDWSVEMREWLNRHVSLS